MDGIWRQWTLLTSYCVAYKVHKIVLQKYWSQSLMAQSQIEIKLGECRTLLDERKRAAQWFGNFAEFEQGQNRCCQHHMTSKQRVVTAVFSQYHHKKMVLHRCFVLINTCSILNFVFELAICLLYHLQLHTRACAASQWLQAYILQLSHGCNVCVHPDVNVLYVHYIACANN